MAYTRNFSASLRRASGLDAVRPRAVCGAPCGALHPSWNSPRTDETKRPKKYGPKMRIYGDFFEKKTPKSPLGYSLQTISKPSGASYYHSGRSQESHFSSRLSSFTAFRMTEKTVLNWLVLFGIQPQMHYNRYGVPIISLIPSPLGGGDEAEGDLTFGNSALLGLF